MISSKPFSKAHFQLLLFVIENDILPFKTISTLLLI